MKVPQNGRKKEKMRGGLLYRTAFEEHESQRIAMPCRGGAQGVLVVGVSDKKGKRGN
jgi:hypothetical protein